MEKRCVVLGGGISGLSTAWRCVEKGIKVSVFEINDYIGGLSASIRSDGHMMDFGPHSLFSEDEAILQRIIDLFDGDVPKGKRDVRLYMHGEYLQYPLKAEDIFMKLGIFLSLKCFFSYMKQNLRKRPSFGPDGPNLEQWSILNFGKALHELFFKPYSEQFWDVPCSALSPDCIPTSKQINFFKTLKLLFTPRSKRMDISIVDREMLPCYYPQNGFGSIGEKIAERITRAGGEIATGFEVKAVRTFGDGRFVVEAQTRDGRRAVRDADAVISTIPIPALVGAIDPSPPESVVRASQSIQYLSLLILYVVVDNRPLLDSMYEYSLEKPYNRITDVNRFTLAPMNQKKENMLAIEKSCHYGDSWWNMPDDVFLKNMMPHLEAEGLLRSSEVKRIHLLKAPQAYPMYLYNYQEPLNVFKNYIQTIPNIRVCGRTGSFQYMDIDQCIKQGFQTVESIFPDR